jgi:hypothetical protein
MAMEIRYACRASGEPAGLNGAAIRAIATETRRLLSGPAPRPLDLPALARRTAAIRINGRALAIAWDWDHAVHDPDGAAVLGCCETDPGEPGMILISLNGALLAHQPELLRSTAAHEFAHAIFDMPAAMAGQAPPAYRLHAAPPARDWREWRADEFMGEFLAPRAQLAKALAREAGVLGVELTWRAPGDVPAPAIAPDQPEAIDAIVSALAHRFGVSESFIAVRLARNGFIERNGRP